MRNDRRSDDIVQILMESGRPLFMHEIQSLSEGAQDKTIRARVNKMIFEGRLHRTKSGKVMAPGTLVTAPREQCLLCIERGCTIDALAELWEHGYREGRGI